MSSGYTEIRNTKCDRNLSDLRIYSKCEFYKK
jgi:hypothetical protein